MPDLIPLQWWALSIAAPTTATCIAGLLWDGLTTESDTTRVVTQLHHIPKAEYVRYVSGWDAEAIQRSVQAQRPVVPPSQHQRAPYHYRRN